MSNGFLFNTNFFSEAVSCTEVGGDQSTSSAMIAPAVDRRTIKLVNTETIRWSSGGILESPCAGIVLDAYMIVFYPSYA